MRTTTITLVATMFVAFNGATRLQTRQVSGVYPTELV
jgi:hypothetical protein